MRAVLRACGALLAPLLLALASPAAARDEALANAAPDGAALYQARCAACHDKAADRTPAREVLARMPASLILSTMRHGAMAPMAEGLAPAQMVAIANYVGRAAPAVAGDPNPEAIWGPTADKLPLAGPRCTAQPKPLDLAAPRWNGWSPTALNHRFQPEPGLAAADAPRLKLKWAFNYPGAKNGQATVIGDRVYVTSMSGSVYMLDAETGCVHWRHAAEAATRSSVTVVRLPGAGQARHALFFSDWTKSAVALDADTGQPLWKTRLDDSAGLQMTGAPTVHGRTLLVPISSGVEAFAANDAWECCKFRGSVAALDMVTGKLLWKTYTTPVEPKPFKVNRLGRTMWGPAGGAIWSAPTVDAKRNLVYVGTSNSYTDVPHDGSDAVIAMDLATGAIRWKNQLLANDNYIIGCQGGRSVANCPSPLGPDFSIGNSPMLVDLADGRQLLVVGQKSGHVHALDPARNGAVVWRQRIGQGSALGGVEFGLATDGQKVFVGISDVVSPKAAAAPGLYALRLTDGALLWSSPSPANPTCRWKTRWCHGAVSQAVTAIPGVVFAGAYDGRFRAYDAATGKVVWEVDTGTDPIPVVGGRTAYGGMFDGAGPTVAGGRVFVHSGYAGRSGEQGENLSGSDGNVLMAFTVDGR